MRIPDRKIDPRVKLIYVICISSLAAFNRDILLLSGLLVITLTIAFLFEVNIVEIFSKLKNIFYLTILVIIIQSLFVKDNTAILKIWKLSLLTKYGLDFGLEFFLRIVILIYSASILYGTNSRELIQGLIQMKMPYELAFMALISIRFLPMIKEEIKDSLIAIQLRGVDLKRVKFKQRISIYSYLFFPIVISSIERAKSLSVAIELRGFRAYDSRSSRMELVMTAFDYILISIIVLLTAIFIILSIKRV